MPKFSKKSLECLNSSSPELQKLFRTVIKKYDCSIICGHRSKEEQAQHFKEGTTKVKYSKHNDFPSQAVDVTPYPIPKDWGANDWKERAKFYHFAGYVKAKAERLNISIRWGGDWNGNNTFSDQTFDDLVHFELN